MKKLEARHPIFTSIDCIGSDTVRENYVIRSVEKIQRKIFEEFWTEAIKKGYLSKTYSELPIENIEKDYLEFISKKSI
jgi:hypothetical protein